MAEMRDLPHLDVVVTHYDDPRRLAWVLDALAAQTYPEDLIHVVVADDGSPHPPRVRSEVAVVTQADEGFRAAAARNLGAAHGRSPYVVFLDGDTVPEPGWCAAMTAALTEADEGRGALVVGRRCHADLGALGDDSVAAWVAGPDGRSAAHRLDDPAWLTDGYARTDDLRDAGPGDWRLVISATMGMTRAAFMRLDGFDASMIGYGGEDWDLAYRAWNTGVALRHAPDAIAWHDGPDAGERPDLPTLKEGEQLALAERIPQPDVRGRHATWRQPRVVVRWRPTGVTPSAAFVALESWLALGDVGLWCDDEPPRAMTFDARVRRGEPTGDLLGRAEFVVDVHDTCRLLDPHGLLTALEQAPRTGQGVSAARTRHRALGVAEKDWPTGVFASVAGRDVVDLEAWGRRWWR